MTYNILSYGAVADGVTVNTTAIQAAIDACALTGGRVEIPAGTFVTGTIWLKSHVELHLCHGAVLKASTDYSDYNADDAYPQNFGSKNEQWRGLHLIIALEVEDVAITGSGIIDGSGDAFFEAPKFCWYYCWAQGLAQARDKEQLRPGQLVCFIESQDILVENLTMRNATCWCCFLHGCDRAVIRGLRVYNLPWTANTDGIDIDSCAHVTVSDCIIDTGDDAIALRCNPARLKNKEKACEYINISNCTLASSSSVFRLGVGNGHLRHIQVSNITMSRGEIGINFCAWGTSESKMEDIHFSDIAGLGVAHPICINGGRGYVRHCSIRHFRADAVAESYITGNTHTAAEDILLQDVTLRIRKEDIPLPQDRLEERGKTMLRAYRTKNCRLERVRVIPDTLDTWEGKFLELDCQDLEIQDCDF